MFLCDGNFRAIRFHRMHAHSRRSISRYVWRERTLHFHALFGSPTLRRLEQIRYALNTFLSMIKHTFLFHLLRSSRRREKGIFNARTSAAQNERDIAFDIGLRPSKWPQILYDCFEIPELAVALYCVKPTHAQGILPLPSIQEHEQYLSMEF